MNIKKKLCVLTILLSLGVTFNLNASEVRNIQTTTRNSSQQLAATDVVTFDDSNLEQVIIEALATEGVTVTAGNITFGDMESLTELDAPNEDIASLNGLESATNLTSLNLSNNLITDLTPISGLTNLTYLNLGYNDLTDLGPISELTNLTSLYLNMNHNLSDLTPISELPNLTYLNLDETGLSDLTPLSGLTNLKELSVVFNQITDISPLSGLTNLEKVWLYDQSATVENITVSDINEVFYNVIDIDGNEVPVSLGVIDSSVDEMSGTFSVPNPISSYDFGDFSGTLTHTIALRGNEAATTNEEIALSDEQLIELFGAENSVGLTVTVDQSEVDYATPGEYTVSFTDERSNELTSTLTVTDLLPTISTDSDSVTVSIGSDLETILSSLNAIATEATPGDLTDSIVIDDSAVDYNTAGTYELVLTVTDEEGNVAIKTISVIVEADEVTTDSETGSEVISETDSEVTSETDSEDSQMSLATTGSLGSLAFAITLIAIVGLSKLKVINNK